MCSVPVIGAKCRANLIMLPNMSSQYIQDCVHVPHIVQLWYVDLQLCTKTKVITVAVKSCIFKIQTCYNDTMLQDRDRFC